MKEIQYYILKNCEKSKENQSKTAGQILPFDSVADSYFQWDFSQRLLMVYIGLSPHPTPLLPVSSSGSWMRSLLYIWLADITKIFRFGTKYKATLQSLLGQEQDGWQGGKHRKSLGGRRSSEASGRVTGILNTWFSPPCSIAQLSSAQQCSRDYKSWAKAAVYSPWTGSR